MGNDLLKSKRVMVIIGYSPHMSYLITATYTTFVIHISRLTSASQGD